MKSLGTTVVEQSMFYAKQLRIYSLCNSVQEMRVVLSELLLSGYLRVPRRKIYWEQAKDVHNLGVS